MADELITKAAAESPTRTRGVVGRSVPVIVTSVPPATFTRVGLIEVIENGPTLG